MNSARFLARQLLLFLDMSESQTTTTRKFCQLCGQPIAKARLEALPGVTTCIDCARKYPRKVDTSMIELSQASRINKNGFAPNED